MTPTSRPPSDLERLLGPGGLLIALVTAAVAGLTGALTSHVFAAVAIVLFGIAAAAAFRFSRSHVSRRRQRAALASVALLATAAGAYVSYSGLRDLSTREVRDEQALVEELSAGQDISFFTARLGSPTTKRRDGDFIVHQFERDKAFLQAVAAPTGEVMSYAVYATEDDFNPEFSRAGVTLNRSVIDQERAGFLGRADKGNAYCGANRAGLWVSFPTSNALDNRTFVLGVYSANGFDIRVDRLCRLLFSDDGVGQCIPYLDAALSAQAVECLEASEAMVDLLRAQVATVFIETSPGRGLTSEMLHTPDEAANLP